MLRTVAFVIALTAAQTAPPPAKTPQPKGKAPVSNEILRVKLPRPAEADLPNGLHLIVLEDRRLPQISFEIIIPGAGGYFDAPDRLGVAAFTASMMREGTTARTSQQIAEQIDSMAAGLSASTGASSWSASISGSSLTEHFDRLLALTADVLLHPTFPQEELDRYKQRTRAGLVQQRTSPQFLANELYARILFGPHPGSRVSPTLESLDKAGRDALVAWHRERYVPGSRGDCDRRRHLARRGAHASGVGAVGLEEGRRAEAGGREPDRPRGGENRDGRASELRPDIVVRRNPVHQPDESRPSRVRGRQPRDRRRVVRAVCTTTCASRRATPTARTAASRPGSTAAPGRRRPTSAPR